MAQTTVEQKKNYLDILAVFHYVYGGFSLVVTFMVLAFVGVGMGAATGWGHNWDPEAGCVMAVVFFFVLIFAGGISVLNLLTGRALQTRRGYVLSLVTAGVNCLNLPLGTLLGIFTLILLADPTVRPMFDGNEPPALPETAGE
jgi:hypothetical protein